MVPCPTYARHAIASAPDRASPRCVRCASAQDARRSDLQRVQLTAGMYHIDAQVAQTPEQRAIGLMYRKEMPQHEGMLFVFEQPAAAVLLDEEHPAAADRRLRGRRRHASSTWPT